MDKRTSARAGKIYALSAGYHAAEVLDDPEASAAGRKWAEAQLAKMGINPHEVITFDACVKAAKQLSGD